MPSNPTARSENTIEGAKSPTGTGNSGLWLVLAGCAVVCALQLYFHQAALHNHILKTDYNDFSDALDYAERAAQWMLQGFNATFSDAHRMPGYPAFLTLFYDRLDEPWLAARVTQVILTSLLPLLAWGLTGLVGLPASGRLAAAALTGLWVPLYYFSTALTAEALTLLGTALYLIVTLWLLRRPTLARAALLALLLALLMALKPNAVFLSVVPPVLAVWDRSPQSDRRTIPWRALAAFVALLVVLVLPWTLFASLSNGQFVPLTTMQGTVLCAGVGGIYHLPGEESRVFVPALMDHARQWLGIDVPCYVGRSGLDPALHALLQERALDRWRDHTATTILYALAKCGHLLGFSLRGLVDLASAGLFVASFGGALLLLKKRRFAVLARLYLIVLVVTLAQTFIFQPDQRFRVVWLDFPALCLLSAVVLVLSQSFINRFRPQQAGRAADPSDGQGSP
ncbi:MAG: hypothetical protein ACPGNT_04395 [Rhodospirillales bacterium]